MGIFAILLSFFLLQVNPLDIPVSLSGSFGELRSGRFHAGIDFRVGGVVGEKVYAYREGYIYRVSVSPTGYGNGLYLRHPDGTYSVYGHLHEFTPEIAERVKKEQYSKKSFSVNLFFTPEEYPVKEHQLIGRVGNSGSSSGPHLHFELRDKKNETLVNPVTNGFVKVQDDIPPTIRCVNFYSYNDSTGIAETSLLHSFPQVTQSVVEVGERFYVAVDAIDRQPGSTGKLAIEHFKFFLDDEPFFDFKIGDFTYAEQNSFNSLIEYGERIRSGKVMIKSLREPGNDMAARIIYKNNGVVAIEDDSLHTIKVELYDQHGNKNERRFSVIRGKPKSKQDTVVVISPSVQYTFAPWFSPFMHTSEGLWISWSSGSIFNSIIFESDTLSHTQLCSSITQPSKPEIFSKIWRVHTPEVPLKIAANITISADVPDSFKSKALIAGISQKGEIFSCGGKYKEGKVSAKIGSFGTYFVAVDTIPPTIAPRFTDGKDIRKSGQLSFTIKDELSGISSYKAEVDGKWVIPQYDLKYNKLVIDMDSNVVERGKKHTIVVTLRDEKGNESKKKCTFLW